MSLVDDIVKRVAERGAEAAGQSGGNAAASSRNTIADVIKKLAGIVEQAKPVETDNTKGIAGRAIKDTFWNTQDESSEKDNSVFKGRKTDRSDYDTTYTDAAQAAMRGDFVADPNAMAMPTLSDLDNLTPDERAQWQFDTTLNLADSLLTGVDLLSFGATAAPHQAGRAAIRAAYEGGKYGTSMANKAAKAKNLADEAAKASDNLIEALSKNEEAASKVRKAEDLFNKTKGDVTGEAAKEAANKTSRDEYLELARQSNGDRESLNSLIENQGKVRKDTFNEHMRNSDELAESRQAYNQAINGAEQATKATEDARKPLTSFENALRDLQGSVDEAAKPLTGMRDKLISNKGKHNPFSPTRKIDEEAIEASRNGRRFARGGKKAPGRGSEAEASRNLIGKFDEAAEQAENIAKNDRLVKEGAEDILDPTAKEYGFISPEEYGKWYARQLEDGGLLKQGENLTKALNNTYGSPGKRIARHAPIFGLEAFVPYKQMRGAIDDPGGKSTIGGAWTNAMGITGNNNSLSGNEQARVDYLKNNGFDPTDDNQANKYNLSNREKLALNVANSKARSSITGLDAPDEFANAIKNPPAGWHENGMDMFGADPDIALAKFCNQASRDQWKYAIHNIPGWEYRYGEEMANEGLDVNNDDDIDTWLTRHTSSLDSVERYRRGEELSPEELESIDWIMSNPNLATQTFAYMADNNMGDPIVTQKDWDRMLTGDLDGITFDRGMAIYNAIPAIIKYNNGQMPWTLDEFNALMEKTPEKLEFGIGRGYKTDRTNPLKYEEMWTGDPNQGLYGETNLPDLIWQASGGLIGTRGTNRSKEKLHTITEDDARKLTGAS